MYGLVPGVKGPVASPPLGKNPSSQHPEAPALSPSFYGPESPHEAATPPDLAVAFLLFLMHSPREHSFLGLCRVLTLAGTTRKGLFRVQLLSFSCACVRCRRGACVSIAAWNSIAGARRRPPLRRVRVGSCLGVLQFMLLGTFSCADTRVFWQGPYTQECRGWVQGMFIFTCSTWYLCSHVGPLHTSSR